MSLSLYLSVCRSLTHIMCVCVCERPRARACVYVRVRRLCVQIRKSRYIRRIHIHSLDTYNDFHSDRL